MIDTSPFSAQKADCIKSVRQKSGEQRNLFPTEVQQSPDLPAKEILAVQNMHSKLSNLGASLVLQSEARTASVW